CSAERQHTPSLAPVDQGGFIRREEAISLPLVRPWIARLLFRPLVLLGSRSALHQAQGQPGLYIIQVDFLELPHKGGNSRSRAANPPQKPHVWLLRHSLTCFVGCATARGT